VNWTNNNLNTSVTQTGLSLVQNQYYYFSVQSKDSAGLLSTVFSSDGQIALLATGINEHIATSGLYVYPNPFTNITNIKYRITENSKLEITLCDVLGKEIILYNNNQTAGSYELTINAVDLQLSKGIYFVKLKTDTMQKVVKIIID
jgi:hypothetical protein